MISLPELELIQILKKLLRAFELDYDNANPKSNSILASIYEGVQYEDRDFYAEAIALFITNSKRTQGTSNRKIKVSNYFSRNVKSPPSIHITAPNEEPFGNSFGSGRGNIDPIFSDANNTYRQGSQKGYLQRHAIIFTSDNHIEVQLMYFTIKYLLISLLDELILGSFQNAQFTGSELRLDDSEKAPENFYMRTLIIESFYEFNVLPLFQSDTFKDIMFPRSNDIIGGDIGDDNLTILNN